MNENNGFILKPEMFNQKEWYEMFMKSIETINNLQSKIDKAIEYIEENINLEMDDFTKIDIGCEILKILDLDEYNEFLKENNYDKCL